MVNIRKTGAYGGYAIVVIIIAVVLFARGSAGMLPGILTLVVGGFLFLSFQEFVKPKVRGIETWLEGSRRVSLEDVKRKHAELREERKDLRAAMTWEEKEENRVFSALKRVVGSLKSFTPGEKRKTTVGEEAKTVEELKPEAKKSLEALTVEMTTSQRFLQKMISSLEKDHRIIEGKVKEMRRRRGDFTSLERRLGKDIEKYRKVLSGEDRDKKIRELRNLEQKLEEAKENRIDEQVLKEVSEAESSAHYLERLRYRIADTVKELQDAIHPDWRDKRYEEMMKRLDRMDQLIDKNLIPAAKQHKQTVTEVAKKVRHFESVMSAMRHSEFVTLRLEHEAKAKDAEAAALEAKKNIADLTQRLESTKTRAENAEAKAKGLAGNLTKANETLARWKADLETAREAVKKHPELESKIGETLQKNMEESDGVLLALASLLMAQQDHIAVCRQRESDAEELAAERGKEVASLEDEVLNLRTAKESAEAELEDAKERAERLEKELPRIEKNVTDATEENVRAEFEVQLKNVQADLEVAQRERDDAKVENDRLEQDLATAESQLSEARNSIGKVQPELTKLREEARQAAEDLERTKKSFERTLRDKNDQIDELKIVKENLEKDIATNKKELGSKEKEIRRLQGERRDAEKKVVQAEHAIAEARIEVASSDERIKKLEDAEAEAEAARKELESRNRELANALAEKTEIADRRAKAILGLRKQYASEVGPAQNTAALLRNTNKQLRQNLSQLGKEVSELQKRLAELEEEKVPETEEGLDELIKGLNKSIRDKNSLIDALRGEIAGNEKMIHDEAARADGAMKRADELEQELESARHEHESAMAELREASESHAKRAEELQAQVDEMHGKATSLERVGLELDGQLGDLKDQISDKTEEIERLKQDKSHAMQAQQAMVERNRFLEQQLEFMRQKSENEDKLRTILQRMENAHRKLSREYAEFRESAENEINALKAQAEAANAAFENSRGRIDKLQRERENLTSDLDEARAAARQTPSLQAQVDRLERALNEKETERAMEEELKRTFGKERDDALARITRLEGQVSGLLEQRDELEKDLHQTEEKRIKEERRAWLDEVTRPLKRLVREAEKNETVEPDKALELVHQAFAMVETLKKEKAFRPEEAAFVDTWRGMAEQIRSNVEFSKELDRPAEEYFEPEKKDAPEPIRLGVFRVVPTIRFDGKVIEYGSSEDVQGRELDKAWVALDYTKDEVVFGRTKTSNDRKRVIAEEDVDVVLTGHPGDIKVLSRRLFTVKKGGDIYTIHHEGYNPLTVVGKDGKEYRLDSGRHIKLLEGMRIFLDREKDFCLEFMLPPITDVKQNQSPAWFRTELHFFERPKAEQEKAAEEGKAGKEAGKAAGETGGEAAGEESAVGTMVVPPKRQKLGYLMPPSHAEMASDIDGNFMPVQKGLILLNRGEVSIGRKDDNDVKIEAEDRFERASPKGGMIKLNTMVSGLHAKIFRKGEDYTIENHGGNGTYVNYRKITGQKKLEHGDVIHFGPVEPIFFIFGMKEFGPEEQKRWKKYGVLFDYRPFNCPMVKADVGRLYCSRDIAVRISDSKGNLSINKRGAFLLNRYAVTFGSSNSNAVVIKADPKVQVKMQDGSSVSVGSLINHVHFTVRREFGDTYLLTSHYQQGVIKVTDASGNERDILHGENHVLKNDDAIQFVEHPSARILFRIEEKDMKTDDYWGGVLLNMLLRKRYEVPAEIRKRANRKGIIGRLIGG